ncbi:unnamed protein product (macronuclear) [Paramecium tetraurelia]|uniref:Uncharacterized protein n=1 Tax=Paramecium tetraurelia TaxID=5888 RepID=A0E0W9_PARTE|nr:uncharacterized protein GSPATT00022104001 [Paramecium tetraurelia]CAK88936.1 unnamed protein product [Paramecium tetraurelia]|eukprot:XP_001456333.1 hypothetical protein (macronuclear) [Paramecium tetraurelia strain d4-2]
MDFEFPQLLNPTDNQPYVLVSEPKEVLNSKLLTARHVTQKLHETGEKTELVVITDFLQDLTKKSPLAYVPDAESQELVQNYKKKKQAYETQVQEQVGSFKQLNQKLKQGYEDACNNIVSKLVGSAQGEGDNVQRAFDSLQTVLKSDPEQEATIPKPKEIVDKISELRAAPELPEYLFATTKKVRAWRNAPNELCVWNKTKEQFYRDNLEQSLNQAVQDKTELALKFWNSQIKKLGEQLLNIIQEDSSIQQQNFVSLNIETAEAFALLLNTMITPETRIILHIGDFTLEQSKSIAESISRLTGILNLQINWRVSGKAQGLSHIAQAISQAEQLKVLTFEFSSQVQANSAKDFFNEFKNVKLPNLEEVNVLAEQSNVNAAVQHISKAVKSIGGSQVTRVLFNFSQSQVDNKSAQQLGDALSTYKGVKKLTLNFSGYSLQSNAIKDDGFAGLIQNVTNFAETLVELTINVGRNQLTDNSLANLNKQFSASKWVSLKSVNISVHYNKITEQGARKLGKFLHNLPILVSLSVNLNSTEVNQKGLSFIINQLGPQVNAQIQAKQSNVSQEEAAELNGKGASLSI